MNPTDRRALGLAVRELIETGIAERIGHVQTELDTLARRVAETADALTELDTATEGLIANALRTVDAAIHARAQRFDERAFAVLERAATVRDGEPGERGEPGRQGEPGPSGSLADVRQHVPGEIYRAGDFVALPADHVRGWAIAKALADTYELPGDDDAPWLPYVFHGAPGRVGAAWRGEHDPAATYEPGDMVRSANGGAWIRTVRGNAAIPGEGWSVLAKRGAQGTRGEPGRDGRHGAPGVGIADLYVDGDELVAVMTDGTAKRVPVPVILIQGGAR